MNFFATLFGGSVPSVSATELSEKLKNGKHPLVVDVREPQEYSQGHIAGAKLIPLAELGKRMKELPKDKEIICVCASGSRSRSAAKFLISQGYNALDMTGGMFAWQRTKLSVKKGSSA